MRGRGEKRVVNQILPVTGEFLAAHHLGFHRAMPAPRCSQQGVVAHLHGITVANGNFRDVQPPERLHQAKAGFVIHGQAMARHSAAIGGGQPNAFGFHDQVAHRQHQPARDGHATAGPFGAQCVRRKGVGRDVCAQCHDTTQRRFQVEPVIGRAGLQVLWNVAVGFGHVCLRQGAS